MPAYNAGRTLRMTYEELPKDTVNLVILVDDGSTDATLEIARELGLEIFVHDRNYGYGANQKTCYTEALRAGCDVVVMVHPDYQYDPTLVPKIIEPILKRQADLVLGSRLKGGGSAIEQGMPWWKYVSNRFLTGVENLAFGLAPLRVPHGLSSVQQGGARSGELPDELGRVRVRPGDHLAGGRGAPSDRRDRGTRPLLSGGLIRELLGLVRIRAPDSLGGGPVSASPDGDQAVAAAHGAARPVSPAGSSGVARRALIAVRVLDIAAAALAIALGSALIVWWARPEVLFLILLGVVSVRLLIDPIAVPALDPRRVVAGAMVAYALVFSFVTVTRHYTFQTHALDLGYYVQLVWNLAGAEAPASVCPRCTPGAITCRRSCTSSFPRFGSPPGRWCCSWRSRWRSRWERCPSSPSRAAGWVTIGPPPHSRCSISSIHHCTASTCGTSTPRRSASRCSSPRSPAWKRTGRPSSPSPWRGRSRAARTPRWP